MIVAHSAMPSMNPVRRLDTHWNGVPTVAVADAHRLGPVPGGEEGANIDASCGRVGLVQAGLNLTGVRPSKTGGGAGVTDVVV